MSMKLETEGVTKEWVLQGTKSEGDASDAKMLQGQNIGHSVDTQFQEFSYTNHGFLADANLQIKFESTLDPVEGTPLNSQFN